MYESNLNSLNSLITYVPNVTEISEPVVLDTNYDPSDT